MKKLISTILCALLMFTMTACGQSAGNGNESDTGNPPNGGNVLDTEEPTILLENLPSTFTLGGHLMVDFTVIDNESSAEEIYIDVLILNAAGKNVTAQTYDKATNIFTPVQTGMHSIIIEAYDKAGNCGTHMHKVNVTDDGAVGTPDTQKPTINLGSIATTIELGKYLTVSYTVHDNVSATDKIKVEIKVINENAADVTVATYNSSNKRFTPQSSGIYTIRISATDEAGNVQTATHTVTVASASAAMPTNPNLPADKAWNAGDVSVHDPSVFYDPVGKVYYAYGSHFATARSSDLMHWTHITSTDRDILGGGKQTVLAKSYAYAGGNENTWAPDVEYYNGKYYMYFSLTSGFGSNKSVIGRVGSDRPTGPFNQDETIIVSSGGTNSPNAIDPELFYDKNGGLWMVYGSFYTGIYIKELYNTGVKWGLPKESGYGTLIWKGGNDGPEGPFVFYSSETDYYYLITSYASLSSNYNMNVARSKNPNGPYVDAAGKNVSTTATAGNKLAGNYQFNGASVYAALGHNSVVKTSDGKYINVFHTRYGLGTVDNPGAHSLRTHQLLFNADGWPVMSPARYAGETVGAVTATKAAGAYDVIIHSSSKTDATIVTSGAYTLEAGGTIKQYGASKGTWQISGDYYITLKLNGITYKGVIVPTWCMYKSKAVLSITAVSQSGVALWANGV